MFARDNVKNEAILRDFLIFRAWQHQKRSNWQDAQSLAPATRNNNWISKSGPNPGAFNLLISKRASCHNGVHFFDIAASKSGPSMVCFVHVDFEMCFASQRCTLFRHRNFQKWSEHGVFCICWLRNVLRVACNFLSHLARWLRTRRFSEPTFRPSGATNHWQIIGKPQCFAIFLPFHTSTSSFFWFFLFSNFLSSTLLFSLTLPISAFHLNILVRSLISKFPSIFFKKLIQNHIYIYY